MSRRRRTAVAALAAVALAVGIPIAVLAGRHSAAAPPVRHIPAAFPITTGFPTQHSVPAPAQTVDGHPPKADLVPLCSSRRWALTGAVDTLTTSHQGRSPSTQASRTLVLFADDAAAARTLQQLREAVKTCQRRTHRPVKLPSRGPTVTYYFLPADLGGAGFAYLQEVDLSGDLAIVEVAWIGNAVLFDSSARLVQLPGGQLAPAARREARQLAAQSLHVRGAMCAFSSGGC